MKTYKTELVYFSNKKRQSKFFNQTQYNVKLNFQILCWIASRVQRCTQISNSFDTSLHSDRENNSFQ